MTPGELIVFTIALDAPAREVRVRAFDKAQSPFKVDASTWRVLVGIDLDAATSTSLRFVFPDFDHAQWTALQHAVAKNQVEAARVLLEWGADPDARRDGATPLFIAANQKDLTLLRLLLDAGADLDRTKAWTETPEAKNDGPLWASWKTRWRAPSGSSRP
jgi:hypothetical protein